MRTFVRTLVATLTIALIGLTGTATAASAAATVDVTAGTLRITGTAADESLIITPLPDQGSYAVTIRPAGGDAQNHSVSGVTKDVIIDLGAGDDTTYLGDAAIDTSFPRSVTITATNGTDSTYIHRATVARDLTLNGRTYQVNNSTIGRNLTGLSTAAGGSFRATNTTVAGQVQFRSTQGGTINGSLIGGDAARVRVTGGPGRDVVTIASSDLGASPRIDTGGGKDLVTVDAATSWSGTFTGNTGSGDDTFFVVATDATGTVVPDPDLGRLNVRLGTGQDEAAIRAPLTTSGSVVDGQGGTDTLGGAGVTDPASQAAYRNFEVDLSQPATPVTVEVAQGDLVVDITEPVVSVAIDRQGTGYHVWYATTVGGSGTAIDVANASGDVRITAAAGQPSVIIGSEATTDIPGRVTFDVVGSGVHAGLWLEQVTVGGDVLVTGKNGGVPALHSDQSVIDGRVIARGNQAGRLVVNSTKDRMSRLQIVGSNGPDQIDLVDSDIGPNPSVSLGGGSDELDVLESDWTGLFRVTAGTGDDEVVLTRHDYRLQESVRVLMGAGDDTVIVDPLVDNGAGSRIQGDAGSDKLTTKEENDRAVVRTFEQIIFSS